MRGRRGSKRPNRLEDSQKKLYLAIRRELALFELKKRKDLVAYERAFRASLPKKLRASSREELLKAIAASNVVLVGDFHPFRQSQKGFLRILEGAAGAARGRTVVALECFQQAHQAAIGEFLAGLITAEELRDKIDFERYWPFSWESYREILLAARARKWPVVALNISGRRGRESELRARDAAAAERIARELKANPARTVFVLYGELHLGRPHLPYELLARLGRRARIVTVHQNDAELYWRAPKQRDGQRPEVLALGPREFCVLNSVPWVKLRSYLDWLEGSPEPDLEENELDAVGIVHHYARILAEALGMPAEFDDSVEILPPDRLSSRGLPRGFRDLKSPDAELAAHALTFHRTGYLPARGALLLPAVSTNSLSEAASHLLRRSLAARLRRGLGTRSPRRFRTEDWIAHFMLGYLGSKILNPKRKCNEVADLTRLAAGNEPRGEIASRALTLLRPFVRETSLPPRQKRLAEVAEIEACRTAGFVLGERFFLALLAQPSLLKRLREMLGGQPGKSVLVETRRAIRKLRAPVASKRERF
jgi:uncharacterized iron-regulated protein